MQTRYTFLLKYVLAFIDLIMLNGAFWAAGEITQRVFFADTASLYRIYLPVANLLWLFSGTLFRLYSQPTLDELESIYRSTWRATALHTVLFTGYLLFARSPNIDNSTFLIFFYLLLFVLVILSRLVGTYIQRLLMQRYRIRKTVAIMSASEGGNELAHYFQAHERQYHFHGYLTDHPMPLLDERGMASASMRKQLQHAVSLGIQEVYVLLSGDRIASAAALVEEGERQCLRVKLVPEFSYQGSRTPYNISIMGHVPVISIRHEPMYDIAERFKKRVFDILFSTLVIVFVLSWLYPIMALLIKLESPGPVLFKQQRSGRDNKAFFCYKFRSMRVNGESDTRQATRGDQRITRIGAFLRRISLDELPQFLNVLQGHMSVVGPRPHMLKHTEQYRQLIDQYMVRQFLKPGITGWAQVNGYRGETTDSRLMERRVAHDIWYLENWTAMLDVRIVFLTVINWVAGEDNAH